MIDHEGIRIAVASGLKNYLECPVIRSNQNEEKPPYPYLSFTVITPKSENKGTFGEYEDGIDRKAVKQIWSITSLSDNEIESVKNANKAVDWLERVGVTQLHDKNIVVQSVGTVNNRDNVLTTDYEYRNGFDVVFVVMDEIENPTITTGEYIETAPIISVLE